MSLTQTSQALSHLSQISQARSFQMECQSPASNLPETKLSSLQYHRYEWLIHDSPIHIHRPTRHHTVVQRSASEAPHPMRHAPAIYAGLRISRKAGERLRLKVNDGTRAIGAPFDADEGVGKRCQRRGCAQRKLGGQGVEESSESFESEVLLVACVRKRAAVRVARGVDTDQLVEERIEDDANHGLLLVEEPYGDAGEWEAVDEVRGTCEKPASTSARREVSLSQLGFYTINRIRETTLHRGLI